MHHLFGLNSRSPRVFWYTGLEAVLELSWHLLQVTHTSSAGSLSPLGLLAPVDCNTMLVQILKYLPSRVPMQGSRETVLIGGNVHFRVLAAGYPHEAQVCFWMWRDRRPEDSSSVLVFFLSMCPSSIPSSNRGTIHGRFSLWGSSKLTATSAQSVRLVMALSEAGSSLSCEVVSTADSVSEGDVEAYSF